jgi:methylmalonyl-CoA/ethylmalonyl-CoA epimerase
MYGKVHHIGIAVKDLDSAIRFYRDVLGLKPGKMLDWKVEGLKAALFPMGDTILELIQPVKPKGQIAHTIAEGAQAKDGIVHHLCYTVDDIEATMADLRAKGVKLVSETPEQTTGGKAAWLDRRTIDGCMIELVEEGYEIT